MPPITRYCDTRWSLDAFGLFPLTCGSPEQSRNPTSGRTALATRGVLFLAPIRFLVVGRSITTLFPRQHNDTSVQGALGGVVLRALTWVLSCAAVGIALSVGLFLIGFEDASG
jgi:hypothetical protein